MSQCKDSRSFNVRRTPSSGHCTQKFLSLDGYVFLVLLSASSFRLCRATLAQDKKGRERKAIRILMIEFWGAGEASLSVMALYLVGAPNHCQLVPDRATGRRPTSTTKRVETPRTGFGWLCLPHGGETIAAWFSIPARHYHFYEGIQLARVSPWQVQKTSRSAGMWRGKRKGNGDGLVNDPNSDSAPTVTEVS